MEGSGRDLFIDKVVDRFVFENKQITHFYLHTQYRYDTTWNRG